MALYYEGPLEELVEQRDEAYTALAVMREELVALQCSLSEEQTISESRRKSILAKNEEIKSHWAAWNLLARDRSLTPEIRRIAAGKAGSTQ